MQDSQLSSMFLAMAFIIKLATTTIGFNVNLLFAPPLKTTYIVHKDSSSFPLSIYSLLWH
jgi:hypothetical protein